MTDILEAELKCLRLQFRNDLIRYAHGVQASLISNAAMIRHASFVGEIARIGSPNQIETPLSSSEAGSD